MRKHALCIAMGVALCATAASAAFGHGFVGDRFFPPTIATDDPFATDELSLPQMSFFTNPAGDGSPESREIDTGFEFDKEILPHLALGVSDTYIAKGGKGGPSAYGWDDVQLSAKYQLWQNDEHEAIVSVGLVTGIGGTGSKSVAEGFTTFYPTFYFGKGFGDLPDFVWPLKPFAVTGTLDNSFPTEAADANNFDWGIAVEYSLPYLQQSVRDVGIPHPLRDMIPLVEFAMTTGENRDARGQTTGTINPGILYETPYCQIGAEAIIPVNSATGPHVGAVINVQIFIDDLLPKVFGHPLFGGQP